MKTNIEFEIEDAIWQVQLEKTRDILRPICIMRKRYLNKWDVQKGKAVCWHCRKVYFPDPKIQGRSLPAKPIKLFPQKDGSYLVLEE